MTAVKVPRGKARETSSSAVTRLPPDPYSRLTERSWIALSVIWC